MAITLAVLRHLQAILPAPGQPPVKCLALGYPDILAAPAQLAQLFGAERTAGLPLRPDGARIIQFHNAAGQLDAIVDSKALMAALGYDLEVIDIARIRGEERILDLNLPCPEAEHQRYGLILDGGTLEHCFNIGQAVRNVAEMTAIGGHVLGINPMSMFNHGFYNLNPTWYHDFYGQNGFEILSLTLTTTLLDGPEIPVPAHQRFKCPHHNTLLVMLARRVKDQAIVWPVQHKYLAQSGGTLPP